MIRCGMMANLGDPLSDDERGMIAMAVMMFAFGGPPEMEGAMLQMLTDIGEKMGITDELFDANKFVVEQMQAKRAFRRRRG